MHFTIGRPKLSIGRRFTWVKSISENTAVFYPKLCFSLKKTVGIGRPMLNFGRPIVKCTSNSTGNTRPGISDTQNSNNGGLEHSQHWDAAERQPQVSALDVRAPCSGVPSASVIVAPSIVAMPISPVMGASLHAQPELTFAHARVHPRSYKQDFLSRGNPPILRPGPKTKKGSTGG